MSVIMKKCNRKFVCYLGNCNTVPDVLTKIRLVIASCHNHNCPDEAIGV